ncbi:T9SS type A sorting domain-containing protein, partial [Patescibacteria group bacterium]|nr:T9SS type A sorting domain-containing protein [Patescibacteria group bacterium]
AFFWWDPYYLTDEPYVDRNGDGRADIHIGRMLTLNQHDVEVQVDKWITYDYTDMAEWRRQAAFFCGDVDYGTCHGELTRSLNDELVSLMPYPLNQNTTVSYQSQLPFYWNREDAAVDRWNQGIHLASGLAQVSNRTCLFDVYSKYYNPNILDRLESNGAYPIVLAQSCGTTDCARGESPYGTDLAYDFLTADWKGAACWIGYSENTSQPINAFMASQFLQRIDMEGSLTLGEIWLQVKQITYLEHPEAEDQNHMWIFLGDPTASMRWTDVPTGVLDEGIGKVRLEQNRPNPFNPTTTISFTVGQPSWVSFGVYDVAGRLVCTFVDGKLEAGPVTVTWDGTNHHGRKVSSGVYFYRLETSDVCLTRKMVLLK